MASQFYAKLVADSSSGDATAIATQGLRAMRAEKNATPDFGHPKLSAGDPRANRLHALAKGGAVEGPHIAMLYSIRDALPEAIGWTLPINVNGAIPAVMLDVGFPLAALKGISLFDRTARIIGHLQEENERSICFIMDSAAAARIEYDDQPNN